MLHFHPPIHQFMHLHILLIILLQFILSGLYLSMFIHPLIHHFLLSLVICPSFPLSICPSICVLMDAYILTYICIYPEPSIHESIYLPTHAFVNPFSNLPHIFCPNVDVTLSSSLSLPLCTYMPLQPPCEQLNHPAIHLPICPFIALTSQHTFMPPICLVAYLYSFIYCTFFLLLCVYLLKRCFHSFCILFLTYYLYILLYNGPFHFLHSHSPLLFDQSLFFLPPYLTSFIHRFFSFFHSHDCSFPYFCG